MKKITLLITGIFIYSTLLMPVQASSWYLDDSSFWTTPSYDIDPDNYTRSTDPLYISPTNTSGKDSSGEIVLPDSVPSADSNYGIPGLQIPDGAIGVVSSNSPVYCSDGYCNGIYCIESDVKIYTAHVNTTTNTIEDWLNSTTALHVDDAEIGKLTAFGLGSDGDYDYGYIYPDQMFGGSISVNSSCFPPDFVGVAPDTDIDTDADVVTDTIIDDSLVDDTVTIITDDADYTYDYPSDYNYDYPSLETRPYFRDIPDGQYYTEPVLDFAEKGYIDKEANYNPGEAITRGDLAEMIIKASERELVSSFNATFTDVPSTHPQAVYIYTGVRDGLWSGKSATQFDPEGKLIRAELAKILANERGLTDEGTGVTFEDWDKTQDWAKPYILRVNEAGIMTGVGDKRNFEPFGTLTRADTTTALWRIFDSVMSGDPGGE